MDQLLKAFLEILKAMVVLFPELVTAFKDAFNGTETSDTLTQELQKIFGEDKDELDQFLDEHKK